MVDHNPIDHDNQKVVNSAPDFQLVASLQRRQYFSVNHVSVALTSSIQAV